MAWSSVSTREQCPQDLTAERERTRREVIAAKRAIALGKLTEFQWQCERLGQLVADDRVGRLDAADGLFEAAIANNLVGIHGIDYIQNCLAKAFGAVASTREGTPT